MKTIFQYTDYKTYISAQLDHRPKGARLRLAEAIGCQPGYVTQVLTGKPHFSFEQLDAVAEHFSLPVEQKKYLFVMMSFLRAGTPSLKSHYKKELAEMQAAQLSLKNSLKPENILSVADQAQFYSSWHYGAVHAAVSIPALNSELKLSEFLQIPLKKISVIVGFLESVGLLKRSDTGELRVGQTQVFVGADSPLITKFHTNWRTRAIQSLDHMRETDLHYSSVISASRDDVEEIRRVMVKTIEEIRARVKNSKDEVCYSYALDLFSLEKLD